MRVQCEWYVYRRSIRQPHSPLDVGYSLLDVGYWLPLLPGLYSIFALGAEEFLSQLSSCLDVGLFLPGSEFFVKRFVIESAAAPSIAPLPARIVVDPTVITKIQEAGMTFSDGLGTFLHADSEIMMTRASRRRAAFQPSS